MIAWNYRGLFYYNKTIAELHSSLCAVYMSKSRAHLETASPEGCCQPTAEFPHYCFHASTRPPYWLGRESLIKQCKLVWPWSSVLINLIVNVWFLTHKYLLEISRVLLSRFFLFSKSKIIRSPLVSSKNNKEQPCVIRALRFVNRARFLLHCFLQTARDHRTFWQHTSAW